MMSIVKKDYDRNYYENILYRSIRIGQRNRNRLKEILRYKNKGRFLEIGCGKGEFLSLAQKSFDVLGVDVSEYAVRCARRIQGVRVKRLDRSRPGLTADEYDVIVALNLLEHLSSPGRAAKKIFDALKPGGILFGSVPNNGGIVGTLFTRFSNYTDRTHCSTPAPEEWYKIFKQAGFKRIQFFGEIVPHRDINLYVKSFLWKQITFNLMFVCTK